MSAGAKRSKPAATAVWVVKRLPARVTARAAAKVCPLSAMKPRARSSTAKAAWPSLRWQTSGCDAEGREQPPATDAEDQLLFEAQLRATAVELAGNAAMGGVIRGVIAVEQVEFDATDLHLPGAQPDRVTRQGDLQTQPLAARRAQGCDRQLSGIVVGIEGLLRAILVDHLAKIALLVEEPHADHRHPQIAGRLELITGHIAQSARIDGQGLAQHVFHAEIGDTAERCVG